MSQNCKRNPADKDNNNFCWLTWNTAAGSDEQNILFQLAFPCRRIIYVENFGTPANIIVKFSLVPILDGKYHQGGGVLPANGSEQQFPLYSAAQGSVAIAPCSIRFRKPITRFYISHGDFGTGSIMRFVGTDDVEGYAADSFLEF